MALDSIWTATQSIPHFPNLSSNIEVDVAIVGAGITGITAASLLHNAGKRVALIEGRTVLSGETSHTTAHLTVAVDTRYAALKRKFGAKGARLVYEASVEAIRVIRELAAPVKDACALETVPGYLYAEQRDQLATLDAEYDAARSLGIPVARVDEVPLPFATLGGVRFDEQAQVHPTRYLAPLVSDLFMRGCGVYENTPVTHYDGGASCRLTTPLGTVRAAHLVFAANAPLTMLSLQTAVAHYRTYAASFPAPQGGAEIGRALFWDVDDPYHYTRLATIDGQTSVVVGGCDHKTGESVDTDAQFAQLLAYARPRFGTSAFEHRWSGQVLEPVDGLPYIGKLPFDSGNVYVATGFSGNGLTFGTLAAQIIADAILERHNDFASLLSPSRIKPLASAASYVRENVDFPKHLALDRVGAGEGRSVQEVDPGQGKVIDLKGGPVAVYRDPEGRLHGVSAVCTHLGCHVKWNSAETSWDCPCHGSRFDVDGAVLNGPALKALEPKAVSEA